jgi:D-glycero-D-manno-heptose 1,7-bisphosphate phosphatase
VFLDRDGVLTHNVVRLDGSVGSPRTLKGLSVTEDSYEQVNRLAEAGYMPIVVTNQPDIARKKLSPALVETMNEYLARALPQIIAVYVCPHDDHDRCQCRKPMPGMLLQAAEEHHIALSTSWMIGDRTGDIEAARRAGVRSICIPSRVIGAETRRICASHARHLEADDLSNAVSTILAG